MHFYSAMIKFSVCIIQKKVQYVFEVIDYYADKSLFYL